ncbi:MAG: hypothetical protein JWM80_5478 [Cyanobacteria bacterium RYN_339]|nr:hypothetical protein [Cyanobacteria bacterium RYN_339]
MKRLGLAILMILAGCHTPTPTKTTTTARSPQPSAAPSVVPSPTKPPSTAPSLKGYGLVLGVDGKPAADVEVRGFLISPNGGTIIGNNGSTIISDGGGTLIGNNGGSFHLLATPTLTAITDANGRFKLTAPDGQHVNLEAVQDDTHKALQRDISGIVDGLTMQLAPTGDLTGDVKADGVTDLKGVDVYIAGTGYIAKTDSAGHFSLPHVAANTYAVTAEKLGLGNAVAEGVQVKSGLPASVTLTLVKTLPLIKTLAPTAGAPGTKVTITGDHFAAASGQILRVTFGGAEVAAPKRINDQTLEVEVPAGAASGDVVVTVGEVGSKPATFAVAKTLQVLALVPHLVVGSTPKLGVVAKDAAGKLVEGAPLAWTATGTGGSVAADGTVTAKAEGTLAVSVACGSLTATATFEVHAAPYLATVAGTSEFGTVDGPGGVARFGYPESLCVAKDGRLLVGENSDIRVIDAGGQVTTLAGGPEIGKTDGRGKSAGFQTAAAIVELPDGNLVVADVYNHALRLVTPDGTVTTIAGALGVSGTADGPGATARFNRPCGLALAADQKLYVCDGSNNRVRVVDLAKPDRPVTTLAGQTAGFADGDGLAASFKYPAGLALGPDGTLYLADQGNQRVRAITPAGKVTTVAGGGPAPTSGYANLVDGPAATARFSSPQNLAVDKAGTIYVADRYNQRVRKIAAGVVSTLAGSGDPEYGTVVFNTADGPLTTGKVGQVGGVAVLPDGTLVLGTHNRIMAIIAN